MNPTLRQTNPRTARSTAQLQVQLEQLAAEDRYWIARYRQLLAAQAIEPIQGELTGARCSAHVGRYDLAQWQQKSREGQLSAKTEITC